MIDWSRSRQIMTLDQEISNISDSCRIIYIKSENRNMIKRCIDFSNSLWARIDWSKVGSAPLPAGSQAGDSKASSASDDKFRIADKTKENTAAGGNAGAIPALTPEEAAQPLPDLKKLSRGSRFAELEKYQLCADFQFVYERIGGPGMQNRADQLKESID